MHALYISLIVLSIHATTWDGMINEWVKKVIKPEGMLYKPIYGCPICMTPWYGTLLYLFFFWNCLSWTAWLGTVGAASGLSVIWVVLISLRDWALLASEKLENEGIEK